MIIFNIWKPLCLSITSPQTTKKPPTKERPATVNQGHKMKLELY